MKMLKIKPLLAKYSIRPKKSLGQNFLVEPTALLRVVETANITTEDSVLEIGAGVGSLTYLLAQAAKTVVAVELDSALIPALEDALSEFSNVRVIEGDMLNLDPAELMANKEYMVVANIPYYITSALIRHLLESEKKPAKIILTMQKEVAERICMLDSKMSLLSLSVQVYGKPQILAHIPAGCFFPVPTVDSSVLGIALYPEPIIPTDDLDAFFRLAHAGFSQKRKTLRNSLASGLGISVAESAALLNRSSIDPSRRAETLTLQEWNVLTQTWKDFPK